MFNLQLRTPANYGVAGFSAVGSFSGATSGTGSGSGYEPLYFINSEQDASTLKGWLAPLGTHFPMEGDGAGTPREEIVYEEKFRIASLPSGTRWLFHLGHNGVTPFPKGLVAAYLDSFGMFVVQIGVDFGVYATAQFNNGSVIDAALSDGLWHKLRIEFKKVTAPFNVFYGSDIKVYLDDALVAPDATTNAIGYWDDSVNQAIAFGGTDTNNSVSASHGDILISSDMTAQLYAPTDDLVYAVNFDNATKKVNVRNPSDPIDPSTDSANLTVVDDTTTLYGQTLLYNRKFIEDTGASTDEIRYAVGNSFPQNANVFDRDFTWFLRSPLGMNSAGASPKYTLYSDDGTTEIISIDVNCTVGTNNAVITLDNVNNTWALGSGGGVVANVMTFSISTASLNTSGVIYTIRFVQSTGTLYVYRGAVLAGSRVLSSINTPVVAKYLGAKDTNGSSGFLKEMRLYDVEHVGDNPLSILDLHGATNTRKFQLIFDDVLNVSHSSAINYPAVIGGDPDVDGWNLDISGAHPTGAIPNYGRSFFSTVSSPAAAQYPVEDIPNSGSELTDQSFYFNLTSAFNADSVHVDYDSADLPQIDFSVADQKVYFVVPNASINDQWAATIAAGSECIVQYNATTKEWAFQVDGVCVGISTYDPTTFLPVQLQVQLVGTASDPGAGFADFRYHDGWIDAAFVPQSHYQYHPTTGTFPTFVQDPPAVDQGIPDQDIVEGANWVYAFPANAFTDPQSDNVYSATLDDDSPLPAGMALDGDRTVREFTWNPAVAGTYNIKVTATNTEGSAFTIFTLTVHEPPAVDQGIPDQTIPYGTPWMYQFPANAFTDPQSDNVYSATLDDDSPLPPGLTLDGDRLVRQFDWTFPDTGYVIKVTATNFAGSVSTLFEIFVEYPPEVDQGIPDQAIDEGTPWSYQFPANAFTDPQSDNVYSATLDDDSPLPAGMTLDGDRTVRTFDWPVPVAGTYMIKVTATNGVGSIFDIFELVVSAVVVAGTTRRSYLLRGIRRQ